MRYASRTSQHAFRRASMNRRLTARNLGAFTALLAVVLLTGPVFCARPELRHGGTRLIYGGIIDPLTSR